MGLDLRKLFHLLLFWIILKTIFKSLDTIGKNEWADKIFSHLRLSPA